jgi:hypothetical protein
MNGDFVGIGGKDVFARVRILCYSCPKTGQWSLNPMWLQVEANSFLPLGDAVLRDGWKYSSDNDVWHCPECAHIVESEILSRDLKEAWGDVCEAEGVQTIPT